MKKIPLIAIIITAVVVFISDWLLASEANGSVLIALLFWSGIGQGLIALAAAADLSGGKWIKPIRPYLHQYYSLLVLFPITFLIFSRHVTVYDWALYPPNGWLQPTFFIIRNTIVLLLPFIIAHFYVEASRNDSKRTGLLAVLYLFAFVLSQSFMAFDQVMTFEYPWINTLFGGYFFVEALYGGIAFSAILAGFLMLKNSHLFKTAFRDFTVMIMGFALLWAGLFYSQYLVIWYGNLPEEVSYIAKRMEVPLLRNMGIYVLLTLFLIPFVALISRKVKALFPAIFFIALLIFSGLLLERLIFLIPDVQLSIPAVLLPMVFLGLPYLYLLFTQYRSAASTPVAE
jgi:hypothetical protein